jgi:predicted SAM-dependent methyltransferase
MNNISIYHKDNIEVPNAQNIYFQDVREIEENSIDNIYLHDCLDFIIIDQHSEMLQVIFNKLKPNGMLHIQAPDLKQLAIAMTFDKIKIEIAQLILYKNRLFLHTAKNIKDILEHNNYIVMTQKYVNVFEYLFICSKSA